MFEVTSERHGEFIADLTASWVFVSLFAILTSCRNNTAGQPWRCRNPLRDAGGMTFFVPWSLPICDFVVRKNSVIGFCRNGAIPLMFHEKKRNMFDSSAGGALGVSNDAARGGLAAGAEGFRRFAGGGLMSRPIFMYTWRIAVVASVVVQAR